MKSFCDIQDCAQQAGLQLRFRHPVRGSTALDSTRLGGLLNVECQGCNAARLSERPRPAEIMCRRTVQDCEEPPITPPITPTIVLLQGRGFTWAWGGICSRARRKQKNHVPSTAATNAGIAAQRSTTNGTSKGRAQLEMGEGSVPAGPAEVWGSSGLRISTAKGGMEVGWGGTVGLVDPCTRSPASGNATAVAILVADALEKTSAANPACQYAAAKACTFHNGCRPELVIMQRPRQLRDFTAA